MLYCLQLLFVAYILEIIKCGTHTVKKVPLATFLGIKVKMTQMEITVKTNSDLRYAVLLSKFNTPQVVTKMSSAKKCSTNTKSENQLIQSLAKSLKNNFMKELSFKKAAGL